MTNFRRHLRLARAERGGRQDLVPFRVLDDAQIMELEVADARFVDHLVVGLTWETAMYARDERY